MVFVFSLLLSLTGFQLSPSEYCRSSVEHLNLAKDDLHSLEHHMAVYYNDGAPLKPEELLSPELHEKFSVPENGFLMREYAAGEFWLRFCVDIPKQSKSNWFVDLAYGPLDYVDVFFIRDGENVQHLKAGDHRPVSARPTRHPHYLFPLPKQTGKLLVLVRLKSDSLMFAPLQLIREDKLLQQDLFEQNYYGFLAGGQILLAMYFLLLGIILRQVRFFYLVGMIVSLLVFNTCRTGHGQIFLWPNSIWLSDMVNLVTGALACTLGAMFTRSFLELWKGNPITNRIFIGFFVVGGLLTLSSFVLPYVVVSTATEFFVLIILLVILYTTATEAYRRGGPARLVFFGWLAFLAGMGLSMLWALGVLESLVFPQYIHHLAAPSLAIFMAVAMASQIRESTEQIKKYNRELIEIGHLKDQALETTRENARLKSAFLANTSHELRTPLNSIINIPRSLLDDFRVESILECTNCQIQLQYDTPEDLSDDVACPECGTKQSLKMVDEWVFDGEARSMARYLNIVVKSGEHLLKVVTDILDLSKIEAGQAKLTVEEVSVEDRVKEICELMQVQAEEKEVSLTTNIEDLSIVADSVKISQVLVNLVGNAIKFTKPEGDITIEVKRSDDYPDATLFSVSDTGIGIPKDQHARIFDSFRQVDGSHIREHGGTGLGLAISKSFVELHGGKIWVESEIDQGSTFSFTIPDLSDTPHQTSADFDTSLAEGVGTIVVVEDEPHSLTLTTDTLKKAGFNVEGTSDPAEAIQLIQESNADLVILDIMMPKISGLTILRQLRTDPRFAKLPVIVSTAYHGNRGIVKSLNAKWLPKPHKPEELINMVHGFNLQAEEQPADGAA
jgi:signal transduction histidine kinase/CheY-like chemotaxis protein